ncbi:magnesium and cobalt transport protein CorA [Cryptosporangium arvum]|uniref:magnesium and cobalt transport protein CorA n=1 Tax=Cryptosporangium arvum TaxID=80871 RepID=UPI001B80CE4A|nr:magnesium and cobalt transport protein CorA [Cryptosporangium arvum]
MASQTEGFVWIGLQQPTDEDIATLAEELSLPPLAVEDAVVAHQRPKLEQYGDVLFAVLKPVRYVNHDEVLETAELALFLGPHFLVTVRHGESGVLSQVRSELNQPDGPLAAYGPAGVLYRAADLVVDGYEEALERINVDVDDIEAQVFGDRDTDHGERIYKLKREIAEFRRAAVPLNAPLQRLAGGTVPGVDEALSENFRDVHDHVLRTIDAIEAHDRLLSDILQADLSRLSVRQSELALKQNEVTARQNEDMRKISAWAAIGLAPTAIAGLYGMNFDNMPELRWEYGYFGVLAVIAAVCVTLYVLFRRNGWL